jgi:hypothetical protein
MNENNVNLTKNSTSNQRRKQIVVIIFFVIVVVANYLLFKFYDVNNKTKYQPSEDCFSELNALSGEKFIAKTLDLNNNPDISYVGRDGVHQLSYYAICRAAKDKKDVSNYDSAKEFILNEMVVDPDQEEEVREYYMQILDNFYSGSELNDYHLAMAFGDYNDLCPDKMESLCLNNPFIKSKLGQNKHDCLGNPICGKWCFHMSKIMSDRRERDQYMEVPGTDMLVPRLTTLFRFGREGFEQNGRRVTGEELMRMACDNFTDELQGIQCHRLADRRVHFFNFYNNMSRQDNCDNIKGDIIESVCSDY